MQTRKRIRLAAPVYRGRGWYFITVCTRDWAPFFRQPLLAKALVQLLVVAAAHRRFLLHGWCVMPEHAHILCEGACDRSAVCAFVNRWKIASAERFERELGRDIWQRSFYEHVLRARDPVDSFLWYIWMNPVRKGVCRSPFEYPWSGSLTVDWRRAGPVEKQWTPPWRRGAHEDAIAERPDLRSLRSAEDVLTGNS
jgi:putative transposase